MNASFQVRGTKQMYQRLQRLSVEAPQFVNRAFRIEAEEIAGMAKDLVPVDMGPLRASIHVRAAPGGLGWIIGCGGPAAPYALYVHEGVGPAVGRPAFMPPPSSLEGWAARHGIPTDPGTLFVLARAIGRRGIPARKFLETPFRERVPGMLPRVAKRTERWMRAQGQGGFGFAAG